MASESTPNARNDWVARVLHLEVPGAGPGAGGTERPRGGIAFRKLLLQWRAAQAQVADSLNDVGRTILGRDDVQKDPRLADVEQVVAQLPKLVPIFGGALEDVLDAGLNEGDGPGAALLARQAIAAIDDYRKQLGVATDLLAFEAFVSKEMGGRVALHQRLDATLSDLGRALAGMG